jgi:hypothetical protein
MNIDLPANAFNVLNMVVKIVVFDIFDFLPISDHVEFSYTEALNNKIEVIGLESQNALLLLGTINLILLSLLVQGLLLLFYSVSIPGYGNPFAKLRDILRKRAENSNMIWRFIVFTVTYCPDLVSLRQ